MPRILVPSIFDAGSSAAPAGGDPFMLLHREVNRLFDDALRGGTPSGALVAAPRMNVCETGQELRIDIELPGVPEQDVEVELLDDLLTVRGEKRAEHEDAQHHVAERSFGTFARTVRLPFAPKPDEVRAAFEHGVLRITVPKSVPQPRFRRIPVRSAGAHAGEAQGCSGTPAAMAGHPTPDTTQGGTGEDESAAHPS